MSFDLFKAIEAVTAQVTVGIPQSILKRKCKWCDREALPNDYLCWNCYSQNAVPEPWKED